MAGIVAQITKANWERKQRSRRFLPPDKSVYFIPPFDPAFDPKRHNVFIRRKTNFEEMHKRDEELKVLRDIMDELARVTEEENRMLNPEPIGLQLAKAFAGAAVLALPVGLVTFLAFTFWEF